MNTSRPQLKTTCKQDWVPKGVFPPPCQIKQMYSWLWVCLLWQKCISSTKRQDLGNFSRFHNKRSILTTEGGVCPYGVGWKVIDHLEEHSARCIFSPLVNHKTYLKKKARLIGIHSKRRVYLLCPSSAPKLRASTGSWMLNAVIFLCFWGMETWGMSAEVNSHQTGGTIPILSEH